MRNLRCHDAPRPRFLSKEAIPKRWGISLRQDKYRRNLPDSYLFKFFQEASFGFLLASGSLDARKSPPPIPIMKFRLLAAVRLLSPRTLNRWVVIPFLRFGTTSQVLWVGADGRAHESGAELLWHQVLAG